MVQAVFSSVGKLRIPFLEVRKNRYTYIHILECLLLSHGENIAGLNCIFKKDNASINSAKETKKQVADNNITTLDQPAKNPDINPMENIWGILVGNIYRKNGKMVRYNSK